jgi:uncharacterized protein YndB with AHSA1/START domain
MVIEKQSAAAAIEPVVKEISVPLGPERAFALFTEGIAGWWPLASHSVAGADAVGCHFEPRVGGRLVETARDGSEHVWGTVTAWDPPARLALTWHPGRAPETAQELTITFTPEGESTRLRLVHSGWERLGDDGRVERDNYEPGWDYVLGFYVAGVNATAS